MDKIELSPKAEGLLKWLATEDFSQYGECHGKDLDELVAAGLAQIHAPGEHQSGFIAQDRTGSRGDMYRAVSLTEAGRSWLLEKS